MFTMDLSCCAKTATTHLVLLCMTFYCQGVESNQDQVCDKVTTTDDDLLFWTCSFPKDYPPPIQFKCVYYYKRDDGDFKYFSEYTTLHQDDPESNTTCILKFPASVLRPGSFTFKLIVHPSNLIGEPDSNTSNSNTESWRSDTVVIHGNDNDSPTSAADVSQDLGVVGIVLICLAIIVVVICVVVIRARMRMASGDLGTANRKADSVTQNMDPATDPLPTVVVSESANNISGLTQTPQDGLKNSQVLRKKSRHEIYEEHDIAPYPLPLHTRADPESESGKNSSSATTKPRREDYDDIAPYPLPPLHTRADPETDSRKNSSSSTIKPRREDYDDLAPYPLPPLHTRADPEPDSGKNSSSSTIKPRREDYDDIAPYPLPPLHTKADPEPDSRKNSSSSTIKPRREDYDDIAPYPLPPFHTRADSEPDSRKNSSSSTIKPRREDYYNIAPYPLPPLHTRADPEPDSRKNSSSSTTKSLPSHTRVAVDKDNARSSSNDVTTTKDNNNGNIVKIGKTMNREKTKKISIHGDYEEPDSLFLPSSSISKSCNNLNLRKSTKTDKDNARSSSNDVTTIKHNNKSNIVKVGMTMNREKTKKISIHGDYEEPESLFLPSSTISKSCNNLTMIGRSTGYINVSIVGTVSDS